MMKKTTALVLAVLTAALMILSRMNQQGSRGIFYRITGGKNDLYLLGSIHVGSKEMYPFSQQILTALQNADTLIFECDTQSEQAALTMQTMMRLPEGKTLAGEISSQTAELVESAAKELGYSPTMFQNLKPWAVTSMLTTHTAAKQMNHSAKNAAHMGVEEAVRKEAGNKTTLYLETVEEQLGLMDAFSSELQDYLLHSACKALLDDVQDEQLKLWPKWWHDGNEEAFAQNYLIDLSKEPDPNLAREYHTALMTTRNRTMAQNLARIMEEETNGECFAVIGLMHLALPGDSVIEELKQLGYYAERIAQ